MVDGRASFNASLAAFKAIMETASHGYGVAEGQRQSARDLITHMATILALVAAQSEDPAEFIAQTSQMAVTGQTWAKPFMDDLMRQHGFEPLPAREQGRPS